MVGIVLMSFLLVGFVGIFIWGVAESVREAAAEGEAAMLADGTRVRVRRRGGGSEGTFIAGGDGGGGGGGGGGCDG